MQIIEAIQKTDELRFNSFSEEEKISWLNQLDWLIYRNIMEEHEDCPEFEGYREAELDQELLVPEPFCAMYIYWLQAQMDLVTGETDRYNANILTFNHEYEGYEAWYKKHHMPLAHGPFRF